MTRFTRPKASKVGIVVRNAVENSAATFRTQGRTGCRAKLLMGITPSHFGISFFRSCSAAWFDWHRKAAVSLHIWVELKVSKSMELIGRRLESCSTNCSMEPDLSGGPGGQFSLGTLSGSIGGRVPGHHTRV